MHLTNTSFSTPRNSRRTNQSHRWKERRQEQEIYDGIRYHQQVYTNIPNIHKKI